MTATASTALRLDRVKTYPRLSEDSTAFSADLLVNGVLVARLSNDGHGGCHQIDCFPTKEFMLDRARAAAEEMPPLPPDLDVGIDKPLAMDLDLWISMEVDRHETRNLLKRHAKTKVIFTLPGDEAGAFRTVSFKASGDRAGAVAFVLRKYPNAQIVEVPL